VHYRVSVSASGNGWYSALAHSSGFASTIWSSLPATNRRVLLQTRIFSVAFLGIEAKADDVAIRPSDRLEPRLGRGGVADLSRISKINVQHGENVRLIVLRARIGEVVTTSAGQLAGARAQSERKG
jgi:hypothetical protein